jgi:hypothetical protein
MQRLRQPSARPLLLAGRKKRNKENSSVTLRARPLLLAEILKVSALAHMRRRIHACHSHMRRRIHVCPSCRLTERWDEFIHHFQYNPRIFKRFSNIPIILLRRPSERRGRQKKNIGGKKIYTYHIAGGGIGHADFCFTTASLSFLQKKRIFRLKSHIKS